MAGDLSRVQDNPKKLVVRLPPIATPTVDAENPSSDRADAVCGIETSPRFTLSQPREEDRRLSTREQRGESCLRKLEHSVSQRVWHLSENAGTSRRMLERAKRQGLTGALSTSSIPTRANVDVVGTTRCSKLAICESKLMMLNSSRSKLDLPTWGGARGLIKNHDCTSDKAANERLETAERWLDETLDQSPSVAALKRADDILCALDFSYRDRNEQVSPRDCQQPSTPSHKRGAGGGTQWIIRRSLVLSGIGQRELRAQRVPLSVVERIYPALYVYSSGVYEFLKSATAHCDDANLVLGSLWTAYSMLLEQCFPSDYEMAVQAVTKKLADSVNSLTDRFESRFGCFLKDEKRNQTKIISLEHGISRLKLRNDQLEDDLSKTSESLKSATALRQLLANQNSDLSQNLQEVTAKSDKLQKESMRFVADVECSQELLQVERCLTSKLEHSLKTEKTRASNLSASLGELDNEVSKLRYDTTARSQVIQSLEASSTNLSEQLDAKTQILREMTSTLTKTREDLVSLRESNNEVLEDLKNRRKRESKLFEDLASAEVQLVEEVSKRHAVETTFADVSREFRETNDRLKEALQSKGCLQEENARFANDLRSARGNLTNVHADLRSLREKFANLESEHSSLQASSEKTKLLMDEAQKECGITSKKLAESDRKLKYEQKNAKALHKKKLEESAKFRSKLDLVNGVLGSTRAEIAVTRKAKLYLEDGQRELSDQLKIKSLDCDELARKLAVAKRELSMSHIVQSDLQKQLEGERASLELCRQEVSLLTDQVKVAKAARFQAQKRADHSRVQLKSVASEHDAMANALQRSKERLVSERSERLDLDTGYKARVLSLESKIADMRDQAKLHQICETVKLPREKCELLLLLNDVSELHVEIENAKNGKAVNRESLENVAAEIAKQKSALASREKSLAQVQADIDATRKSLKELLASKAYAKHESKVVGMKKDNQELMSRCALLQATLDDHDRSRDEMKSNWCTRETQIGVVGLHSEWIQTRRSKMRDATTEPEISFGERGKDLRRDVRRLMKTNHVCNETQTDGEGVPAFSLIGYFDKQPEGLMSPCRELQTRSDGNARDAKVLGRTSGNRIGGGGHTVSVRSLHSPRRKRKLLTTQQILRPKPGASKEASLRRHSSLSYRLLPSVVESASQRALPSRLKPCAKADDDCAKTHAVTALGISFDKSR